MDVSGIYQNFLIQIQNKFIFPMKNPITMCMMTYHITRDKTWSDIVLDT